MDQSERLTRESCFNYVKDEIFARPTSLGGRAPSPDWPGRMGIEVEMIPVHPGAEPSDRPGPAPLYDQEGSVEAGLKNFCKSYLAEETYQPIWLPEEKSFGEERLYSLVIPEVGRLTFEPGGQLELSSYPQEDLSTLLDKIAQVQTDFDKCLAKQNIRLVQAGINPWHSVEEVGLQLRQGRYVAMDRFLGNKSSYGPRMMRLTCSIQVNLDFGEPESTLMERYLATQLLAPIATAIFANSPIMEGQLTELAGLRAQTWQHLDPSRTGILLTHIPGRKVPQTKTEWIENYLEYVMAAEVVFFADLDFTVPQPTLTFGTWLEQGFEYEGAKHFPTLQDFKTHLSLLFSEVRPRGFMEIRSIDGQSRLLQYVPMVFYLGLLYDGPSRGQVLELLLPFKERLNELMAKACFGLQDPTLAELAQKLGKLALAGIEQLPTPCRHSVSEARFAKFYEHYTSRGLTPAEDWRQAMTQVREKSGTTTPGLELWQAAEGIQAKKLS